MNFLFTVGKYFKERGVHIQFKRNRNLLIVNDGVWEFEIVERGHLLLFHTSKLIYEHITEPLPVIHRIIKLNYRCYQTKVFYKWYSKKLTLIIRTVFLGKREEDLPIFLNSLYKDLFYIESQLPKLR